MARISSFANEDVLRELNLIEFTLPTGTYLTPYVDISKYSSFNVFASTSVQPLAINLHHSVDASFDPTKEVVEPLTTITSVNTMTDLGPHTVKSRFLRVQLVETVGTVITLQLVFRKAPLSLTSSTTGGAGLVTVGTGGDFPTIEEAVAASSCNIRVITDVVETTQVDLSANCPHLRVELDPGITLSNTIVGDWFIGSNTLLKIEGAGAHMDLTTSGLSSQIVLQAGQTFRSGGNAELDVEGVRFTGSGTNDLLSGSSRVNKCRFDGAARFDLDLFEKNLFVDGCLFTVDVQLDSLTGAEPKSAIISNNIFDNGANITIVGADDLVFNGNTIGKTSATPMLISGTSCSNVVISNNVFEHCELTISSTNLTNTNISNNVWARDSIDGMTISSPCSNFIVSNNVVHHITMNNTVIESVIGGNTLSGAITVTQIMTNSKITNNCAPGGMFFAALLTSVIGDNLTLIVTFGSTTWSSIVSGNTVNQSMTFSGDVINSTILANRAGTGPAASFNGAFNNSTFTGNVIDGTVRFSLVNKSSVSGNTVNSFNFSSNVNDTQITGNTMYDTGSSTFIIAGACSGVVISSNFGFYTWSFSGQFIDGTFSDNRVSLGSGPGSISFGGIFADNTMTGNNCEGVLSISDAVTSSVISSNTTLYLNFGSTVEISQITNNTMSRTVTSSLVVGGDCIDVVISDNQGGFDFEFNGNFEHVILDNNVLTLGSIFARGTIFDSSICGNIVSATIDVSSTCTLSKLSNNRAAQILLNSDNSGGECSRCVVIGNVLNSNIILGSPGGGAGADANIISNNHVTSITCTDSNDTDNIVTSNRCPNITGFGGTDVISLNI